jgi:hypothetical protein
MAEATSLLMAKKSAMTFGHLVEDMYLHFAAAAVTTGEAQPYLAMRLVRYAEQTNKDLGLLGADIGPCSHFFMELARRVYDHWLSGVREESAAAVLQDSAQRAATELPIEVRLDTIPPHVSISLIRSQSFCF